MPQILYISDNDIAYAENILLPHGKVFDEERRNFIRNFDTIDLQAVPGSGKTTALLAKLLILEKKLPFEDGSGILVISHTNAAVDEIKAKIHQHCPRLFTRPNFIGTIQSFVDEFLAIPYYCQLMKRKPVRIDNDIFWETFLRQYSVRYRMSLEKRLGVKFRTFVEEVSVRHNKELIHFYTFKNQDIPRISNSTPTYLELVRVKSKLIERGILNFNDAYTFAKANLIKHPYLVKIFQQQFKYVFVDEMQDMATHQFDLLETIFYNNGKSLSNYQRIGDKNQAIYNGDANTESCWKDRDNVLLLNGSQRLSPPIAKVVNNFALYRSAGFSLKGLSNGTIKPHLIIFKDETIGNVIPAFMNKIRELCNDHENGKFKERLGELRGDGLYKYPVKVIAWNAEWPTQEEKNDILKIRLTDYHVSFSKDEQKPKIDYPSLRSYLVSFDKTKKTLNCIKNNIINALIRILRLENINDKDGRYFSKQRFVDTIQELSEGSNEHGHDQLALNLYNWSIGVIRGKSSEVFDEIKKYIPILLNMFGKQIDKSSEFIHSDTLVEYDSEIELSSNNKLMLDDIEAEVTTVHAVKGQTHSATLYLETFYNADGSGANKKSYESQRLADQFLGTPIELTGCNSRVKQSAKMAYVGFSRPTDFLCFAVHADRYEKYLNAINKDDWEILKI